MIGKKLKELIKLRNIKQIKLAKYVGISPSRLSNYLSDKREPDLEMLAKMARYLSVDLNYFTDIRFPSKKDAAYGMAYLEESSAMETVAPYVSDDAMGVVEIPYLSINSKKRAAKTKMVSVSRMFLKDIENPQENAVLFEVTTGIGGDNFRPGDFIVAVKFDSMTTPSGSLVFETGRNGKSYRYLEDKGARVLLSEDTKEITYLPEDKDLSSYYVIVWVIRNP